MPQSNVVTYADQVLLFVSIVGCGIAVVGILAVFEHYRIQNKRRKGRH